MKKKLLGMRISPGLKKWMLKKSYFLKINTITIGSVVILILVGSIVRTLGAGMGCPDWPKCFGKYIPPTSPDQLPDNYLEIFRDQRIKKNGRLASIFANLGYEQFARKITNDPAILKEQAFSITKAWVEYINRLVGVLIGLFIFLNFFFSFAYWKDKRWIPIGAFLIFILTGFQGWVGSLVVSTNLLHGFITFHMLLALLILALLIWTYVKAKSIQRINNSTVFSISMLTMLLLLVQIILGTEVRAIIDNLIADGTPRIQWVSFLDVGLFYVHRSFSWLILIGAVSLFYFIRKTKQVQLKRCSLFVSGLVIVGMILGIGMTKFSFQEWMQPLHLIVATGLFGLLFYINLCFKFG